MAAFCRLPVALRAVFGVDGVRKWTRVSGWSLGEGCGDGETFSGLAEEGEERFNTEDTEIGARRAQRRAGPSQLRINRMRALPGFVVAAEGSAELDGGEAEFVAELVGGFGEFFEFFAAVGFEEVELLRAVREGR